MRNTSETRLETSPEVVAGEQCPLCGSPGERAMCKDGVAMRRCGCVPGGGVLLAWARASEQEYERLYAQPCAYHVQAQTEEGQPPSYQRDEEHLAASRQRVRVLADVLAGAAEIRTVMDVGSGLGGFVQAAREAGYLSFGLEPSPDAGTWARRHGRPTLPGAWQALAPAWDLVTMHDVFEHLTRPRACLFHLGGCLSQSGRMIIEMPEWDSPHQRACAWEWRHLRPRQHVCLYSRASAETLFARCGYHIEAFWRPCDGALGKAVWVLRRPD